MPIHIILADDHNIVRYGTQYLLKEVSSDLQFHHSSNFPETIKLLREQPAHLLICDINMPGGDNFDIINTIRSIQPKIKILIFSAYSENLYALRYLKEGANGYLHKDSDEQEIRTAVNAILKKGRYVSENIANQLMHNYKNGKSNEVKSILKNLSKREIEVALLLTKGLGLLEISNHLNIQMSTTSTYKSRLYEKLSVSNIAELITLFRNEEIASFS